jgi:hypothetical protein
MLGVKQEPKLYRIAGEHRNGGGSIATTATTATAALGIARQWVEQGVRHIIITTPKGVPYDLDNFGQIASTKHDADRT